MLDKISTSNRGSATFFSDATGYKNVRANFYAIQDNFLDSTNVNYYIPIEITKDYEAAKAAKGEPIDYTSNGLINVVDALFTDYNSSNAWTNSDPFDLTTRP